MENGRRALFFGSNPHSKGEAFSRSIRDRADTAIIVAIKRRITAMARKIFSKRIIIIGIRLPYIIHLPIGD